MNEKTPLKDLLLPEGGKPKGTGAVDKIFKPGIKGAVPRPTKQGQTVQETVRELRKKGLTEKQIQNHLKSMEQKKDIKGSPHQGVKTDQEGNPILSIAKGGMVKKKTRKSKVAGRLAKRGYGAARK